VNPLEQTAPRITAGPADGLFCAWLDNYTSIGAQLLDATGAMQWSSSGAIMASSVNEIALGSAFRTSNGFYGVIYGENVSGGTNRILKAQALDANGNLMWDSAGEPVSTVLSPKSNIQAIPDTCGGLIAVWTDDRNGSYSSDIYAQRVDPGVGVSEMDGAAASGLSLRCAPNPCRTSTKIVYALERSLNVNLEVFDTTGRRVRELVSAVQAAGVHEVTWHGTDEKGNELCAGVYFLSLEAAGTQRAVHKVILLP
jgi:hypothetical protein